MLWDILIFGLGIAAGAAGYRYYLKRDPAKLEAWAAAIKAKAAEVEARLKKP